MRRRLSKFEDQYMSAVLFATQCKIDNALMKSCNTVWQPPSEAVVLLREELLSALNTLAEVRMEKNTVD